MNQLKIVPNPILCTKILLGGVLFMHGPDSKMPRQEEMGGFQMTKVDVQNEQPQGICTWGPHGYIEIVANLLKPSVHWRMWR